MNVQALLNSALAVRDQFPAIPPGWHYLDSAATAQKPQAVIDAIANAYGRDYALVHAAMHGRIVASVSLGDRVDHRLRLLRGRGAVEIVPAGRDRRELVAQGERGIEGRLDVHATAFSAARAMSAMP